MERNHNELEAVWRSRARDEGGVYRSYLDKGNLADKVHQLLALVTDFHQHLESGDPELVHRKEPIRKIDTYANGTFLGELNHVITMFQRDY